MVNRTAVATAAASAVGGLWLVQGYKKPGKAPWVRMVQQKGPT